MSRARQFRLFARLRPLLWILGGAMTSACADATGPVGGCCKVRRQPEQRTAC